MKRSELIKLLKKHGCYFLEEGTRHELWRSEITGKNFVIWRHTGSEIPTGTLRKILKEAGIRP
ncbi:MAG: type II toxin-antitoxin system HicA family toxin [Synergistaceae bacterium]|nr:type II toxin-antitoxin system HicA family toxin [Synergistaceae bacterium]